ncbi:MAG: hypothetical protein QME69_10335 [Candidatus Saccharicenans sp.]|nr:hypothetical protein [Candidatus Saccharicenans sp.]
MKNDMAKLAADIFEKKRRRRRQLARLPFEKKIEIVVELQKVAASIRGDNRGKIWPLGRGGGSAGHSEVPGQT